MDRGLKKLLETGRKRTLRLAVFGVVVTIAGGLPVVIIIVKSVSLTFSEMFSLSLLCSLVSGSGIYLARQSYLILYSGFEDILTNAPEQISSIELNSIYSSIDISETGYASLNGILLNIRSTEGKTWNLIIDDHDLIDIYYYLVKIAGRAEIRANIAGTSLTGLNADHWN